MGLVRSCLVQDCAVGYWFATAVCQLFPRQMNFITVSCLVRLRLELRRYTRPSCIATNVFSAVTTTERCKGDYGFNVFHNSNPQHGGSYARHERRMRDDEVEDFLRSVKGWVPVQEYDTSVQAINSVNATLDNSVEMGDTPPTASQVLFGEEAIRRTFTFPSYYQAYLFMGRVWAFCYCSDKYPHVTWEGCNVTVYLYSPSFRGLSRREACVAAFLNDTYNMFKKSQIQQTKIIQAVAKQSIVEQLMGKDVQKDIQNREALRALPLQELKEGPKSWEELVNVATHET